MRHAPCGHASLAFEALYYGDRLHVVNPHGDVGILTLWSPVDAVRRKLQSISPEVLDPERSRVAVVANLYGNGMYAMFCNLLYNPQIRHLIALGDDRSYPTCSEIEAFLASGLEDAVFYDLPMKRIRGSTRLLPADEGFDEQRLRETLTFRYLGRLTDGVLSTALTACLRELPVAPPGWEGRRIRVEMRNEVPKSRPSDVTAHQVVRRTPLTCWEELVVRTVRFGRRVQVHDGTRLELLNVKAVVLEPVDEPEDVLRRAGFSLKAFREYQRAMLDPVLRGDSAYSYGNRLRGYFQQGDGGQDTLQTVSERLRGDPQTRMVYVSIWDTSRDLPPQRALTSAPCLTTLSFRRSGERLHLAATYRVHNLLDAWLENVYGLMAVQRYVSRETGIPAGPLSVISHLLGIDPQADGYGRACRLAEAWTRDDDRDPETGKLTLRFDPHGDFTVEVDERQGCIVVEHHAEGVLLKRYQATRADRLAREIIGDMAVSLPSHALWLGTELARKEQLLRERVAAAGG